MFDLLTEVKKMKTMMGLIKEDQDLESINKHAQNILNILKFSGLYSATIKKLIDKIIKFGETNIIDFDLIEKNQLGFASSTSDLQVLSAALKTLKQQLINDTKIKNRAISLYEELFSCQQAAHLIARDLYLSSAK